MFFGTEVLSFSGQSWLVSLLLTRLAFRSSYYLQEKCMVRDWFLYKNYPHPLCRWNDAHQNNQRLSDQHCSKISNWSMATSGKNTSIPSEIHFQLASIHAQAVLDVYALLLVGANALSKPREEKQSVAEMMQTDGSLLIIVSCA